MRITIFGANGKVGSLLVAEALKRGHDVVAFVHSSSNFAKNDGLQVVQGDIYNSGQVAQAIADSQTVISALGSWGTQNKDILEKGMQAIIPAMVSSKVARIISLTGGGANAPGDQLSTIDKTMHSLMNMFAHKVLDDGEQHIRLLSESTLGWTVIRSPIMTTIGSPSIYKLTLKRPSSFATIHRQAVVTAMLDLAEREEYVGQAPYITR